jgi:hypothetical protein
LTGPQASVYFASLCRVSSLISWISCYWIHITIILVFTTMAGSAISMHLFPVVTILPITCDEPKWKTKKDEQIRKQGTCGEGEIRVTSNPMTIPVMVANATAGSRFRRNTWKVSKNPAGRSPTETTRDAEASCRQRCDPDPCRDAQHHARVLYPRSGLQKTPWKGVRISTDGGCIGQLGVRAVVANIIALY